MLSAHLLRAPLLGPPHLHAREPDAARFVGDTSPQVRKPSPMVCVRNTNGLCVAISGRCQNTCVADYQLFRGGCAVPWLLFQAVRHNKSGLRLLVR